MIYLFIEPINRIFNHIYGCYQLFIAVFSILSTIQIEKSFGAAPWNVISIKSCTNRSTSCLTTYKSLWISQRIQQKPQLLTSKVAKPNSQNGNKKAIYNGPACRETNQFPEGGGGGATAAKQSCGLFFIAFSQSVHVLIP